MVFEHAEQLQRELTDKYVMVDERRPELARFKGWVGQVKTVNMSGRALVQFDRDENIGWYDIEPDFLRVVDKPPPPPPEAKAEKKAPAKAPAAEKAAAPAPVGEKKLSPLEMARMQGAGSAKPAAPAAAKPSTADILAAARAKKGEAPAAAAPAAAPAKKPAAPAGKVDRAKLSVEDMLAMARGQKPPGTSAPAASAPPAAEPEVAEAEVEEAPSEPAPAEPAPVVKQAAAKPAAKAGDRPKAGGLTTDQIIAWCQAHDAK